MTKVSQLQSDFSFPESLYVLLLGSHWARPCATPKKCRASYSQSIWQQVESGIGHSCIFSSMLLPKLGWEPSYSGFLIYVYPLWFNTDILSKACPCHLLFLVISPELITDFANCTFVLMCPYFMLVREKLPTSSVSNQISFYSGCLFWGWDYVLQFCLEDVFHYKSYVCNYYIQLS